MKIVAISDTHGYKPDLPDGDVLIHAGDFLGAGNYREMLDFLGWLNTVTPKFKRTLIVPGNHDKWVEANPVLAREELAAVGATLLIDESVTIDGKTFYGTPWTPIFLNWAFMDTEAGLARRFAGIPDKLNVLITHGPPNGYLDVCQVPPVSLGSTALLEAMDRVQPHVTICGHIHEGRGTVDIGYGIVCNVSILNENYRNAGRKAVVINLS
jgi:Icc-related predicted phosphoesterase